MRLETDSTSGVLPERRAGRYVLGDRLGAGGMAEVFAGQALGSHGFAKPVAIKRILPRFANDRGYVDRLIGEAKLLVAMQHGNVVSVLDLVRDADAVFLVMEFVDGPSLRQLVLARNAARLSALPLGVITYVVQAAATGLEFAHARPGGAIVHADVSPSNLLFTTAGEVKVADFGIARREGCGAGTIEGKWAYMAPEQARGEALTPRADVFALGVVLYELLTGVHPFAPGRDAMVPQIVAPPSSLRPEIPPALDQVCLRAIAHAPAARLPSMQHLIDALTELRFTHGWREGAPDLAQGLHVVRRSAGGVAPGPRTQVTGRPITIATHSLLAEMPGSDADRTPIARPRRPGSDTAIVGPRHTELASTLRAGAPLLAARGAAVAPSTETRRLHAPRRATPRWAIAGIAAGLLGIVTASVAAVPVSGPSVTVHRDAARSPLPASELPTAAPTTSAPTTELPTTLAATAPAPIGRGAIPEPAPPTPAPLPPPAPARGDQRTSPRGGRGGPAVVRRAGAATLRVAAMPWAYATVDGSTYETPATIKLAPGTYVVRLVNPDTGMRQTRRVTIAAGKTTTLTVQMRGK